MAAITVTVNKCDQATLAERKKINENLEKVTQSQTHWYDAPSAEEYRRWRREGLNGYPKPFRHPNARTYELQSQHGSHKIPLRVIPPTSPPKGVYLHFHAGGFVIGSAASHDALLSRIGEQLSLVVVSVEYRMAPEDVYPAAEEDCLDAAVFALSEAGVKELGGELRVIAGESAGAYLTIRTILQLRDQGVDVRKRVKALVPNCGIFDLTYTPSCRAHKRRVIMGGPDTARFIDAYLPPEKYTMEKRKAANLSPLYDELHDLPPALFLCGTTDPLLDDSVFMATRYSLANNTTELELTAEGCHGVTLFPLGEVAEEGIGKTLDFLTRQLQS